MNAQGALAEDTQKRYTGMDHARNAGRRNAGATPVEARKSDTGDGSRSECPTQRCWSRVRRGRGVVKRGECGTLSRLAFHEKCRSRAPRGRGGAKLGECGGHFWAPADKRWGVVQRLGLGALDPATEVQFLPPQPLHR